MRTLTKPWNSAPVGSHVSTDAKDAETALIVDEARLAQLEKDGFFAPGKARKNEVKDGA
jgi:hypothetical protein